MPIVLEKSAPELAIMVRHSLCDAAACRGWITQHKVRHGVVAIKIAIAELAMRRKGRLVAQGLVGLNVKAHGESVPSLSNGQGIVKLLYHIVTFHRPVVGVSYLKVPLGKLKYRESFVFSREPLEILNAETLDESRSSWTFRASAYVHIARESEPIVGLKVWLQLMATFWPR